MTSKLDSLKQHTMIVADTGDIQAIEKLRPQDATSLEATADAILTAEQVLGLDPVPDRAIQPWDAEPERALPLFGSLDGVQSVEPLVARGVGQCYALELSGDDALTDTAPAVAGRLAAEGIKLYALQPETRDLETICLKAMEKEKDRRYPTARALADDLSRKGVVP